MIWNKARGEQNAPRGCNSKRTANSIAKRVQGRSSWRRWRAAQALPAGGKPQVKLSQKKNPTPRSTKNLHNAFEGSTEPVEPSNSSHNQQRNRKPHQAPRKGRAPRGAGAAPLLSSRKPHNAFEGSTEPVEPSNSPHNQQRPRKPHQAPPAKDAPPGCRVSAPAVLPHEPPCSGIYPKGMWLTPPAPTHDPRGRSSVGSCRRRCRCFRP